MPLTRPDGRTLTDTPRPPSRPECARAPPPVSGATSLFGSLHPARVAGGERANGPIRTEQKPARGERFEGGLEVRLQVGEGPAQPPSPKRSASASTPARRWPRPQTARAALSLRRPAPARARAPVTARRRTARARAEESWRTREPASGQTYCAPVAPVEPFAHDEGTRDGASTTMTPSHQGGGGASGGAHVACMPSRDAVHWADAMTSRGDAFSRRIVNIGAAGASGDVRAWKSSNRAPARGGARVGRHARFFRRALASWLGVRGNRVVGSGPWRLQRR